MSAATQIPEKHKEWKAEINGDNVRMVEEHYTNGRLRIQLWTTDFFPEPFATLTMNLPDQEPGDGGFFVKTYSENETVARQMFATGMFEVVAHPSEVVWRFAP